jgi:Ca2+-binding EF-hand superfamily protein
LHPFTELEQPKAYITADSFENNLPKYMGHKCDFLTIRLFSYLSDGVKIARVYFRDFLEKFYCLLWTSDAREKSRFVFSLLDTDGDGVIGGPDLIKCQELVDMDSKFGRELQYLLDHYVTT